MSIKVTRLLIKTLNPKADPQVIDSFGRDCFVGPDPLHVDDRFCIGDEHYVSTLLAVSAPIRSYV